MTRAQRIGASWQARSRAIEHAEPPPLLLAYAQLRRLRPEWAVNLDAPSSKAWLRGSELVDPAGPAFRQLVARLSQELASEQRSVLAAALALRLGAAASATLGPYLIAGCVPQISLEQLAFKLGPRVLLEGVALRSLRYVTPACRRARAKQAHPQAWLLSRLRESLCAQTEPLVRALSAWSRLQPAVLWGLFASAWARECVSLGEALGCPERAARTFELLVQSDPRLALGPTLHRLEHRGRTRLRQVRGSCCLYYRAPGAPRCASCPALPDAERERRFRAGLDAGAPPPCAAAVPTEGE